MAADVATLAGYIKTALATASPPIRVIDYLKDNPPSPCALIGVGVVDYHNTAGNASAGHNFKIFLVVSRASDRSGYKAIETYMSNTGDNSIRNILEGADGNLGKPVGTVQCVVHKAEEPKAIMINANPYIGVVFEVTVYG